MYCCRMSDSRQVFGVSLGHHASTLVLSGELDVATVPQFVEAVSSMNGADEIILDLGALTFIDSSGLHAIAGCARAREPDGKVTLTEVAPNVFLLFKITCLTDVPNLRIHERA